MKLLFFTLKNWWEIFAVEMNMSIMYEWVQFWIYAKPQRSWYCDLTFDSRFRIPLPDFPNTMLSCWIKRKIICFVHVVAVTPLWYAILFLYWCTIRFSLKSSCKHGQISCQTYNVIRQINVSMHDIHHKVQTTIALISAEFAVSFYNEITSGSIWFVMLCHCHALLLGG